MSESDIPARMRAARKLAYQRTFCGDGTSPHVSGEKVLADLHRFAHSNGGSPVINPSTGVTDTHMTYYRLGMQDLLKRINLHLGLNQLHVHEFTQEKQPNEQAKS